MTKQLTGLRIIEVAKSWKGTPFFHNLRKKGLGADCLGFIIGTWEEAFNAKFDVEIKLSIGSNFRCHRDLKNEQLQSYVKPISLSEKQTGDVICFQLSKDHWHLAFVNLQYNSETLIHARSKLGVVEEDYSRFWESMTHSIYRLTEV